MSVQTRIFTNHTVTQHGSPFNASLMLDDAAQGNVTLVGKDGPALTIDAARLEPTIALLQECLEVRTLMSQSATDLLVGEPEPNELI
ncbi:MAG: hypothetical protein J0J04_04865 [Microbacterium sp.]|uniref:hypothetical protein n=1 Tax=Microbacterium sp. TaxID=51671 RepID=UPI001AC8A323|nr:hypothetical protein [Microbacterium sp.]MBN9214140.1 hypothetical protein [Microbacterium sp.]